MPDLAQRFRRFAVEAAAGASPLYERLSRGAAEDPEVLAILEHARPEQQLPMLLLAAVHHEILRGVPHSLAAHFGPDRPTEDPYAPFAAFCREHGDALRELCATRRTQTNETGRCAVLLPCLATVSERAGGRPLALIECGASAGLNLNFDRYAYDYGGGLRAGPPGSPLTIPCELSGAARPPLDLPAVAARRGIDLHPLDPSDPDDARWLQACVWPDQPGREARLAAALAIAREHPVAVEQGDALERLPAAIAEAPDGALPVVFHSAFAAYLDRDQIARLEATIADAGRPVAHVALESPRLEEGVGDVARRTSAGEARPGATRPLRFDVRIDGALHGTAAPHGQALHWDGRRA